MTALSLPTGKKAIVKGGRAFGGALATAFLAGLCLLGLALMARGAMVPAKAWVAQLLLDHAFERSLASGQPQKPWPWADTAPVARISVERLGVSDIVLSGGSGQAMAFGPTELPGNAAVTLMAAHRDTHFAFLKDLRPGDMIRVERVEGGVQHYKVRRSQIVRWDAFAYPADPARPLLALATCYPFDSNRQGPMRYVLWAQAVD